MSAIPHLVNASSNAAAKIGNNFYDNLEDAIANASSTDIIMLTSNVTLENTLKINKTVNLNLNGRTITAPSKVFEVQGGTLNLDGTGTIKETLPNYGAVMIRGSASASDTNYSVVNVGKDVTLEGWSGIFINHTNSTAYGVVVNLDGKINAISDVNGESGIGVYVNGNIKHQNNPPIVNILDNAKIVSNGNGLYIAGYSIFNIGKAYISGLEAGIGIKAGVLNINGATVISTGEDSTPTEGYNNGIKASGTALQIESNPGYAGNMQIDINSGNFTSNNSHVIYEYIGKGNSTLVNSMRIAGGTFINEASKEALLFSDSFKDKHQHFITGGIYSSNPNSYLHSGYTTVLESDLFNVVKSTMKEINSNAINIQSSSNYFRPILITSLVILILIVLACFNRKNLINFLKK